MGFDLAGLARQVAGLVRLGAFDTSTDAGRSRERYRRVGLTFLATVAGRGAAAVASLIAVPVMLRYLGAERYGLWAAISSAGMALLFADLGIGNGLLSVLAEDAGRGDRTAARRHVSSAFVALLLVALALGGVFALVYPHVPWSALLRAASDTAARESGPAVAAFLVCFLASMPLGIVTRVRLAHQEGFANSAWSAAGSFVGLGFLVIGIRGGASLPWLVLGLCTGPLLALLAQSLVLFTVQQPWLRPRWAEADGGAARRILRLGFAFSVLQLAGAAATASDALVAGMVLGPVSAAQFAVVAALFELPLSLLIMLLTPMWPAYGEALARHDVPWMKKALRRSVLLAVAFGLTVGGGLVLLGRPVIRVWVGEAMVPSVALLAVMAARLLVLSVGQALAVFLNGARLIRLQLAFGPAMAVVAVVLKVLGGESLGLTGLVAGGVAAQVLLGLVPYGLALRRWPGSGGGRLRGEAASTA
jgi:O-antigen/teichoic acid export membrane protein